MQAQSQRASLWDTTKQPTMQLLPGQSVDAVVQHDVMETGQHTLECAVSYRADDGDTRYFRRLFRFQVTQPLVVKPKVATVASQVLAEVQVANITTRPMYMESVRFEPAAAFSLADANSTSAPGSAEYAAGMRRPRR